MNINLETQNDIDLLAAVKADWQHDIENLDAHILRLQARLAEAEAERELLVERLAK